MFRDWILGIPYIQYWGYIIPFIAAFLETLPGIGLFIPGQTAVLIAGFLADEGVLSLPVVLVLAILAAVLGDLLGYWIGRKYGVGFMKKQRGVVNEVRLLLKEHPIKTLVLGRFNSLTRAFAPFTAGASKVPRAKFYLANILGGILWGTCWTFVGYIVGASFSSVSRFIDIVIVSTIAAFMVLMVLYRYLKRKQVLTPKIIGLLIACVTSLVIFSLILIGLGEGGVVQYIDMTINQAVPSIWNNALIVVMVFFTSFIQPSVILAFSICVTLLLAWRKDYKHSSLFAVAMLGAALIDGTLKVLIMRERPLGGLLPVDAYSFPSGHAFLAVVFFGGLALTYAKHFRWKKTLNWTAVCFIVLIAASRIYLGVHWLSDVLAGLALGVFWLSFVFLCYEGWSMIRKKKTAKVSA